MTRSELKDQFDLSNSQCTAFKSLCGYEGRASHPSGVIDPKSNLTALNVGKVKDGTSSNRAKLKSIKNGAKRSWWNGFSTRTGMAGRK